MLVCIWVCMSEYMYTCMYMGFAHITDFEFCLIFSSKKHTKTWLVAGIVREAVNGDSLGTPGI